MVEIVFIPFTEPWRNAHTESSNSRFDGLLWQSTQFKDLHHMIKKEIGEEIGVKSLT